VADCSTADRIEAVTACYNGPAMIDWSLAPCDHCRAPS
jgi:hypothetical protein